MRISFSGNSMVKSFLRALPPASLLFALTLSLAYAAGPPSVAQTAKGPALADAKGMTLYTFDKDSAGKSACNGKCAENWPPLMADSAASPPSGYSVIARDDGQKQWAYKGKPLYGWVKDAKPGDTTGDGVNGSWHIATP
jgi:predicted lipoprotein with Yx(FWY)xxD motif